MSDQTAKADDGKTPLTLVPHLWHLACNIAFLCEKEDDEIVPILRSIGKIK